MKLLGYFLILLAVIFFSAGMIEVTYLKDYIPWVQYEYKTYIFMFSIVIGIILVQMGKLKEKS